MTSVNFLILFIKRSITSHPLVKSSRFFWKILGKSWFTESKILGCRELFFAKKNTENKVGSIWFCQPPTPLKRTSGFILCHQIDQWTYFIYKQSHKVLVGYRKSLCKNEQKQLKSTVIQKIESYFISVFGAHYACMVYQGCIIETTKTTCFFCPPKFLEQLENSDFLSFFFSKKQFHRLDLIDYLVEIACENHCMILYVPDIIAYVFAETL